MPTQELGRLHQGTPGTDPISTGSEVVSYFGKYQNSPGFFPQEEQEYDEESDGHYTSELVLIIIKGVVSYAVTDALGLHFKYGNVSNADLGGGYYGHTWTIRSIGTTLPIYTVRARDRGPGGSPDDNDHYLDCITPSLTHSLDNAQENGILMAVETIFGIKGGAPAANPSMSYPAGDSKHFAVDSNFECIYDYGGSSQHDYANEFISFAFNFDDVITEDYNAAAGTLFVEGFIEGVRTRGRGVIVIRRHVNNTMYSEYQTDMRAGQMTKRDWRITVARQGSSGNEFIRYDFTDVSIKVRRNYAITKKGEIPTYEITFRADVTTPYSKDKLNSADYYGTA